MQILDKQNIMILFMQNEKIIGPFIISLQEAWNILIGILYININHFGFTVDMNIYKITYLFWLNCVLLLFCLNCVLLLFCLNKIICTYSLKSSIIVYLMLDVPILCLKDSPKSVKSCLLEPPNFTWYTMEMALYSLKIPFHCYKSLVI